MSAVVEEHATEVHEQVRRGTADVHLISRGGHAECHSAHSQEPDAPQQEPAPDVEPEIEAELELEEEEEGGSGAAADAVANLQAQGDTPSGGQQVVAKLLISNAAAGSVIGKVREEGAWAGGGGRG